jgi:murein DD-endopeptidase MepM/ murein hydrolase activator NlpD
MIRLKTLLEQSTKKIPNVLFVTDNAEDRRKGFAKQLITNSQVTGDIRTVDKGSLAQLKDTLSVAISSYYDLVVVITRGIYEPNKNPEYGLTILDAIKNICKTANIPLVLNTIPSVQFIDPEFAKQINFTLANDAEFDRFIEQIADYVLDTSIFNDNSFFNKTGLYLTRQAHEVLYDQMINILNDLGDTDETIYDVGQTQKIIAEPGSTGRHVRVLQRRLIELGYEINDRELSNQKFGDSTAAAIVAFKMKHGLNADAVLDKQTINKLKTAAPEKIIMDTDKISADIAKQKSRLSKGEIIDAMKVIKFLIDKGLSAAGAAGIAGNMKIESNFKTSVLGDNGTSIGLCQWHMDRKDKLFSWTEENGYDPLSTKGQLEYLWWELTTLFSRLTSDLKIIEDPKAAAYQFAKDFEVPAQISENRMEYAQQYFDAYTSGGADETESDTESDSDSSLVGLLGLTGILGAGMLTSATSESSENAVGGGVKILGNNIRISIPGAGSHAGQSGWQSGNAWDIGAPVGTPVYAVNSGTLTSWSDYGPKIIKKGNKKLFGCGFTVKSDNSLPSVYYTHLKNTTVKKGSKVKVGQLLGYVMDFPGSSFDHLHIGISSGDISQFVSKDGTIKRK